jgi:hypothetical protein
VAHSLGISFWERTSRPRHDDLCVNGEQVSIEQQSEASPAHLRPLIAGSFFRGRYKLWCALCVPLVAAYFSALLFHAANIYDEGLIVDGAVRILRGEIPYRDFNTGYAPAQFYAIAGVFSAFGTNLVTARIWDVVWNMAVFGFAIGLTAAISRPRKTPLLPLVCLGLLLGACGTPFCSMTNSPTMGFMLPSLAALWCAVLYFETRATRWLFMSGASAGIAILYRHDLGACLLAAVIVAVCQSSIGQCKWRRIQFVALLFAGVLATVFLPALYFCLFVPKKVLIQSFIDFPRMNVAGRHLPLPSPVSIRAWCAFYMPLAIIIVAAYSMRRTEANRRSIFSLLLVLTVLTLAHATQRLDISHAFPAIIFSMLLLSASMCEWQKRTPRFFQGMLLSGTIICYVVMPLSLWIFQVAALHYALPSIGTSPCARNQDNDLPELPRAGRVCLDMDQRKAVEFVRRRLLPGKFLYVGAEKQGSAWYNDALFYFLADRPSATRYDMFVPGITTTADVQSEILTEIRQRHAEYVVLLRVPSSHEPNLSSVDSGINILDTAIRQDYTQVAEFGRYTIWSSVNLEIGPR